MLSCSCVTAELSVSTESRESHAGGAHRDNDGAPRPPAGRQRSTLGPARITRKQQPLGGAGPTAAVTGQRRDGRQRVTSGQESTLQCCSGDQLQLIQSNVLLSSSFITPIKGSAVIKHNHQNYSTNIDKREILKYRNN